MEIYKLQNAANYKLQNTNYKTTIKAKLSRPQLIVYITQFFSVKNYNWSWQAVRVLGKQGLFGIRNSFILPVGDHQNIKLQLLNDVLNMAGGVLGFGKVQRKFKLSVVKRSV